MVRRIWLLYRIEFTKALRRRQAYVAPLLLLAAVGFAPLVRPVVQDGVGDYAFIAYVTPLALNLLGYIMLLTFSASLVSSEMERGAIRCTLVRPVTRRDFLTAKLLLAFSYAALLTAIVGVASWTVVATRGDLMGVHVGGELVYTSGRMFWSYVYGALLALLPQWAGASLAVLFSTMTRNSSMAISLSLGTWILSDLLKYPLHVAPFVFTTYLEAPWQVFNHYCEALDYPWLPMAWRCVATSVPVIVVSAMLAFAIFGRRNLGTC